MRRLSAGPWFPARRNAAAPAPLLEGAGAAGRDRLAPVRTSGLAVVQLLRGVGGVAGTGGAGAARRRAGAAVGGGADDAAGGGDVGGRRRVGVAAHTAAATDQD